MPTAPSLKKSKKKLKTEKLQSQPTNPRNGQEQQEAKPLKKLKSPTKQKRPVIYQKVGMRLYEGAKALTVKEAKDLLGWIEESENLKHGANYLLKDEYDTKVICTNDNQNRPFYGSLAKLWQSEILQKNWQLNGEDIIIGETGTILDGQHRLIGLVLAGQEWDRHPGKWKDAWQTEPTLETVMVLGIKEDRNTVNTINTGKPRSLGDAIYQSGIFGADIKTRDLKQLSRMADHAVRMLWHRTGAGMDAFAPKRTHAESLDFIDRHPRLLECVKHIFQEDGTERRISQYLSPGYSSALLYLMGSARTEREKEDKTGYTDVSEPTEKLLDWKLWEKAQEFWVLIAGGEKGLLSIRAAIANLSEFGSTIDERLAIIVKAWNLWSSGKSVTPKGLELQYQDKDEVNVLAETPIAGGIDLGNP